jgi:hypothetical protein
MAVKTQMNVTTACIHRAGVITHTVTAMGGNAITQ